jgi:GDPmannose 4,6-dehydratase
LEAIREVDVSIRFCQASSREIFGEPSESPQNESTALNPRSPYGAAKLYADSMIRIYRRHYGIFACSAILYNHESPRRGLNFVTRKVTSEAAKIKLGLSQRLELGSLDSSRDWGYAGDYVRAMYLMLQQNTPKDYIVATGILHSVRELCDLAFRRVGLNYLDYVRVNEADFRPNEASPLVGSPVKANVSLGWYPEVGFETIVEMMVDSDLRTFR